MFLRCQQGGRKRVDTALVLGGFWVYTVAELWGLKVFHTAVHFSVPTHPVSQTENSFEYPTVMRGATVMLNR